MRCQQIPSALAACALSMIASSCDLEESGATELPDASRSTPSDVGESGAGGGGGTGGGQGSAGTGSSGGGQNQQPDASLPEPEPEPQFDAGTPAPVARGGWLEPIAYSQTLHASLFHICLIDGNKAVSCWPDGRPSATVPSGTKAVGVSGSHHHNCFVPPPGDTVVCNGPLKGVKPPNSIKSPVMTVGGDHHACALSNDQSVACWGDSSAGANLAVPAGLKAKYLAAVGAFNCAIRIDDTVVCWGINSLTPPAGLKAKRISVGAQIVKHAESQARVTRHACAIDLGDTVRCWGDNPQRQTDVPANLKAKDIASGDSSNCALKLDGETVCWGQVSSDVRMPAGLRGKKISGGNSTYCVVTDDNLAACFGHNTPDQITQANGKTVWNPDVPLVKF
jgi:Regulator of chromosome condensation (RCC1) repeat